MLREHLSDEDEGENVSEIQFAIEKCNGRCTIGEGRTRKEKVKVYFYTAITRSKQHFKIYWSSESQEKILTGFEVGGSIWQKVKTSSTKNPGATNI